MNETITAAYKPINGETYAMKAKVIVFSTITTGKVSQYIGLDLGKVHPYATHGHGNLS